MNPINSNLTRLDGIENNLVTQGSISSNNIILKNNKKSFIQTKSTNFSFEQNKSKETSTTKNSPKKIELKPLKKNISTKIGLKKPIINVNISTPNKNEEKKRGNSMILNSLIPTNVNSFHHLISGNDYGIFENVNWALGLRDGGKNNRRNNDLKRKKISVTESFNEPSFYLQDLEKYRKHKKNNYEQKIVRLNPNYNKIKHLVIGKKTGNINISQFNFSTCLRDYNKNESKTNVEKEKNWKMMPLPQLKSDNYVVKCLSPITPAGIQNLKHLEKIIPKNYQVNHGEAIVGNDKIKTKILVNNRSYTVSGYGDCLGLPKYNNKFGDNNMFANKDLLSTTSNPFSKFELGLRIYGSHKNIKKHF